MKRLILPATLALSLAFSGPLMFAQQAQPSDPAAQAAPDTQAGPTTPDAQPTHRHHRPDPKRETARLTQKLNLTPDQSSRLEPILADRDQKMMALRTQGLAAQDMHTQMHALQQSTRQQLETVLTPAQMEQLRSMHHARHGAPSPTPADNPSPSA